MEKVTFPLKLQMQSEAVADLQDGLRFLLEKGFFQISDTERQTFLSRLSGERSMMTYGDTTNKLVGLFQSQQGLSSDGTVDEATAKALNAVLEALGAFRPDTPEQQYLVGGQVQRDNGQPLAGALVRAFGGTLRLGEDTTDAEGRYTIRYAPLPGATAIDLRVAVLDAKGKTLREPAIIRNAKPLEIADLQVSSVDRITFQVAGKVASRSRAGVGGLRVQIVDKTVGDDVQLTETVTDDQGAYHATFTNDSLLQRGKAQPDLQARVLIGDTFLDASEVRYNASTRETLNVLLDEQAAAGLQSEYASLTTTLTSHFTGKLGDLQETDTRQDITYLANKTGWDARAVALAALADQFSARTADAGGNAAIEPVFFYALFRAGLPANEDALYQTEPQTAGTIWNQAIAKGVIPPGLKDKVDGAITQFQKLAAQRALDRPALVGVSSLKDILSISLGDDPQQQKQLADLYTQHQGDLPKFWSAVQSAFGAPMAKRLRLDGQLAYLTLNNAPLIRKLHDAGGPNGMTSALNLVEQGYYRTDKWQAALDNDPIPPEISGKDDTQKRGRYADLLAAQVRLSFPTAVVAQMVKNGETPLTPNGQADQVHTFLTQQQGKFEIGMQPVEQYVAQNKVQIAPEVTREVTRIQRVYQITPSNDAMNALLQKGLDSAYAVIRYDQNEFVQTFQSEVGGEVNARLIYAKSQQVHNAALNIAVSYLTASNAPGIGVHSAVQSHTHILNPAPTGPNANNTGVIAYPTLENLFGEMDYCACEHCRSILSPAAYLVDLLLFCDRPTNEKENPQTVLLEHRPDIQHLPLTCDNTNTPLPYIDLVNETLEYYITHNLSLANYTGHTTDDSVTPEELLAKPQFVSDTAYTVLAGKPAQAGGPRPSLPPTPPLPFHQPLENLRRYFDKFDAPLPEVMQALRQNDKLERANSTEYAWRDILMEMLRLSRADYTRLTDRNLSLQELYGYPSADVLAELSKAKAFTRRFDITYEDLVNILKTRFINPHATLIPKLERLGVSLATLKAFKDGPMSDTEFDQALAPHLDASHYGGDIKAWVKNESNYNNIKGLITLNNPNDPNDLCNFDDLQLRYADSSIDPDKRNDLIRAVEFVRLYRFIRLWRALGWTIDQTDKAITALCPTDQDPSIPELERLDAAFLTLLPRLGIVKRIMAALNLKPQKDLLPLLACFAPIDTHGAVSLYRQMFLSPALLKQDGAFADDGYGHFLTDNAQTLMDHGEALRAAFQLTDDEFIQITDALRYDTSTPLSLDTISAVYRRGWLARTLRLSVREFLLLMQFTALDPFAAPDPASPPILRLIELVHRLRALSLQPTQALYLIWNQDISGKSAPDDGEISEFARTLRADLATIESEFALVDDPDGQIARAKMALVYGNDTTDFFFGLLELTFATEVFYSHDQTTLEPSIVNVAPGRIAYDNLRKQLSYTGMLTTGTRDALKNAGGVTAQFRAAVDNLYMENQKVISPFFNRYPDLLPLHDVYLASNAPAEEKLSTLLANMLPGLKGRRKQQQTLQAMSAAADAEIGFASAILDNASVLHQVGDTTQPSLGDLTAIETPGLSAQFFFRDTATGAVDQTRDAEANLAYAAASSNTLPANPAPMNAISGIWSGYVEAPENGFYNLQIEADAGATVTLTLDDTSVDLTRNGNIWSNSAPVELHAGTLYAISLQVEKIKDILAIRWETTGRDWEIIPACYLYSATLINRLRSVYVRFLKAAALATGLKLTAAETAYLAAHTDYQFNGQGWMNHLLVTGSPDKVTSMVLLKAFTALLDFSRLKADLAPDDERLLTVLKDSIAATQHPDSLLFTLTRWESSSLDTWLTHFGKVSGGSANRSSLQDLNTLCRVYDAYTWATKLGIHASALLKATTNEPDATTVRDLQAALRARYDDRDWLNILKPTNDELRGLQRDALVAYILHQMRLDPNQAHIDTPDKLFEHFLMDVQMEPCMQTSRIRHALSSVQLFIERCLMNLEPRVSPSSINAQQWAWMSRYRVWEANRKVFLYPENWLEPELRDDQSPFFKETMSELLQSDITEDTAATALLNYLSKLEEVAKLEPCGIYYVENDPGTADDIAHVVARTAGANRKYYYRRREGGSWTPWEPITLDIEDNPVIPAVWKNRLFLFWLRILQQSPLDPAKLAPPSGPPVYNVTGDEPGIANIPLSAIKTSAQSDAVANAKVTVQAVLCWSEYYNGKWQSTKTSDLNQPMDLGQFAPVGTRAFDRSKLRLSVFEENSGLRVRISFGISRGPTFLLHNTHSLPVQAGYARYVPRRVLSTSTETLTTTYRKVDDSPLQHDVLHGKHPVPHGVVEPLHDLQNEWNAPFFYQDSRHVFYVTTKHDIVPILEWNDIVVTIKPGNHVNQSTLVVREDPRLQGSLDRFPFGSYDFEGPGVVDPTPIERFVSEDAYINVGLGITGRVRYGETEIGPAGKIMTTQRA